MNTLIKWINQEIENAFTQCGYDKDYGMVTRSNRPDLCQYQCNGALSAAKAYRKAPFEIAMEVAQKLKGNDHFKEVTCMKPGFINLILHDAWLIDYVEKMQEDSKLGCDPIGKGKNIMIDYGGPNVAKPLHVGHLRTAVIGECIKRMGRFLDYTILGDVHLGDWGLQIGLDYCRT